MSADIPQKKVHATHCLPFFVNFIHKNDKFSNKKNPLHPTDFDYILLVECCLFHISTRSCYSYNLCSVLSHMCFDLGSFPMLFGTRSSACHTRFKLPGFGPCLAVMFC